MKVNVSFNYLIKSIGKFFGIKNDYDEVNKLKQESNEIEYGIISGGNTIVFIKAGMKGSIYGYKNKYLKIAKALHRKHGCTTIVSSNPNGYKDDFDAEMMFLKNYASDHNFENYQVYYMGHSNGGSLGLLNAYRFPEIKKLLCINGPLMINPHKLIPGIKQFNGEKLYLVYGSKDPSINMFRLFSELESDKVKPIRIEGADHNFKGFLKCFMDLPENLFFDKK